MSTDVEEMLAKMPLRRPSAALNERIAQSRPRRDWLWKTAMASATAAALVVAICLAAALWPEGGEATNTPTSTQTVAGKGEPAFPVRIEQNFSDVRYEGILLLDENTPLRQFRQRTLRRIRWIDEQSGRTVEMEMPDQRIILVTADAY